MCTDTNNILALSQRRYSVRNYTSQPVTDEQLQYMLEVARLAPSAVNLQPWSFIVVRERELLDSLSAAYSRDWFKTAPCCIVVCGNHNESWHRRYDGKDHCDIDIAIATEHLALAATELGLGSCWVCNFDADVCKQVLQLPEGVEPIVLLPIGYPAQEAAPEKKRKSFDDVVIWR